MYSCAIGQVPGNGWAQIVAFAGYYELFVYKYSGTRGGPAQNHTGRNVSRNRVRYDSNNCI